MQLPWGGPAPGHGGDPLLSVDGVLIAPALAHGRAHAFPLSLPAKTVVLHGGAALTALRIVRVEGAVDLPLPAAMGEGEPRTLSGSVLAEGSGRAVLVVKTQGAAAFPWPPGPAVFVHGNSHPHDAHVADGMFRHFAPFFAHRRPVLPEANPGVISRRDWLDIPRRQARLAAEIEPLRAEGPVVLFGRSSGARHLTLYAAHHPVAAVVCLGYPFRHPQRDIEPDRFDHLATITTPTLILQGDADAYGTAAEVAALYPLSEAVEVAAVPGDHGMKLGRAGWKAAMRRLLVFLAFLPALRRPL